MTEIVTHMQKDEVIKSREVPSDWLDNAIAAQAAVKETRHLKSEVTGVNSTYIAPTGEEIGGFRKYEIQVAVNPGVQSPDLPSQVQGIPVRMIREPSGVPTGCLNHGDGFDNMPGGVEMTTDITGGTAGCPATNNGNACMLTAAHLFEDCTRAINGDPGYQSDSIGDSNREFGQVNDHYQRHDWATIDFNNSNGITRDTTIQMPSQRVNVAGRVTQQGVLGLASSGDTIQKISINTGHTTGQVIGMNGNGGFDCVSMDGDGVRISNDQAAGDSGSVCFDKEGNYAYIISVVSIGFSQKGTSCSATEYERGGGWPAYKLYQNAGVSFP